MTTGGVDHHRHAALGIDALPEFLRAAVEWLPTGVLIVNADSMILAANREIERVFGYTSTELIGQSVDVLVPDASRSAHAGLRDNYLRHPKPRIMAAAREVFGRRKDGSEVPVEVRLTPVALGETRFVLASVIDVTDRNRLQRSVRASRDERRQFEALVGDLGAEFVNLRPDDIDRTIEEALGRVVRTLDLDRSALFQLVDESGDFVHTHQWTRPGWPSPSPRVPAAEQLPWHLTQIRAGELVSFETLDEVPDEIDRASLARLGTRSSITVPIAIEGRTWGAVSFGVVRDSRQWTPEVINRLRVVALIFASVLARRQGDEALRRAVVEGAAMRDRLRDENAYLREELKALTGAPIIVGHSPAFRRVLEQIRQAASTDSTVLLLGETGTGKAMLASRIHELSARRERAMVRVNCASLSAAWIESELFGAEDGTFAATESRHVGRLQARQRLHGVPRRDCRSAARRAGDPDAGAPEQAHPAARQRHTDDGGRADHRRDAQGLDPLHRGRDVPRRPVLPAQCRSHSPPSPARAPRRHSAARLAVRGRILRGLWQAGSTPSIRNRWPRCRDMPGRATPANCATSSSAR